MLLVPVPLVTPEIATVVGVSTRLTRRTRTLEPATLETAPTTELSEDVVATCGAPSTPAHRASPHHEEK
jgi:hypothetical protein